MTTGPDNGHEQVDGEQVNNRPVGDQPTDSACNGRADAEEGRRGIRSYVLRRSHFSPAQRAAYERQMPRFGLPYQATPIDYARVFGRQAPVVLEIGFGMGDSTVAIARRAPAFDFIGIEVHTPGVGALLKQVELQGLTNLRVIEHDARDVLRDMIRPASLAAIHVFFPDPWPKARHHKRRLLDVPFVTQLADRLAPGGILHLATDWPDYAEQMAAVVAAVPALEHRSGAVGRATILPDLPEATVQPDPGAPDASPADWHPGCRPMTKFERRGLRLGHPIADIIRHRRSGD